MSVYFTSDTHYGHANVIKHCRRPFGCVEEMTEELIRRWNVVVRPSDEVWHLGDVAWRAELIPMVLGRLNGSIHLVRGNHDTDSTTKLLKSGFSSVHDAKYLRVGDLRIYLHHYACRVWPQSHRGSWHLFGHSHGARPDIGRSTDVGVDCWAYAPVGIEELADRFKDRTDNDHHAGEV